MYYKIKNSASLQYFDTCFMHNIGGVSDRQLNYCLYMYYIDRESCHLLSETPNQKRTNYCKLRKAKLYGICIKSFSNIAPYKWNRIELLLSGGGVFFSGGILHEGGLSGGKYFVGGGEVFRGVSFLGRRGGKG